MANRPRRAFRVQVGQGGHHLTADDLSSLARFPLIQGFADTDDGTEMVTQRGGGFASHGLVGFAKELASLRVPDYHVVAKANQHWRRDLAGEGPTVVGVHILRGYGNAAASNSITHGGEGDEGRP